jgi:hypothetical protein
MMTSYQLTAPTAGAAPSQNWRRPRGTQASCRHHQAAANSACIAARPSQRAAATHADHSFHENKPIEPIDEGGNDTTLALRKANYEKVKAQQERSHRVALMIMGNVINPSFRGALSKTAENANIFMAKIEEHFQGSSKANASILMRKMMQAKYDGCGNVREHILKMIDMSIKLKDLECPLPEPYVIHYVMMSLPNVFENLKINYNLSDKKWTTIELIAILS